MDFNHDYAMDKLASLPRQKEWELYVSKFQDTEDVASAKGKWKLMERIFKMDQQESYQAIDGQIEKIKADSSSFVSAKKGLKYCHQSPFLYSN